MIKQKIIFEIANNHQGDIEHFEDILNSIHDKIHRFKNDYEFVFKFQFRDLDSFINPNIPVESNKHISRFRQTRFNKEQFNHCFNLIRLLDNTYKIMVTPLMKFPANAKALGADYLKIAHARQTSGVFLKNQLNILKILLYQQEEKI